MLTQSLCLLASTAWPLVPILSMRTWATTGHDSKIWFHCPSASFDSESYWWCCPCQWSEISNHRSLSATPQCPSTDCDLDLTSFILALTSWVHIPSMIWLWAIHFSRDWSLVCTDDTHWADSAPIVLTHPCHEYTHFIFCCVAPTFTSICLLIWYISDFH